MAKKIMALVTAIALVVCFAVSASAAVSTTTTYVVGGDVEVNVTVSGVEAGTNVTYYAKNGATDVYVNQEKATGNAVTFNFVTDLANVESDVKVGYTAIDTADNGPIPVPTFTVSGEGFEAVKVNAGETTAIFNYSFAQYKELDNVEVLAGEAAVSTASYADGKITVVFSRLEGDVTLKVNAKDVAINEATIEFDIVDAAAVVAGDKIDGTLSDFSDDAVANPDDSDATKKANADNATDRKLTVCGKVLGEVSDYGIIVSTSAIAEASFRVDDFDDAYGELKYAAQTKAEDGRFAVQIIDTSDNGAIVAAGTEYYTAVYVYDAATDAYYVVPYATTVAAN